MTTRVAMVQEPVEHPDRGGALRQEAAPGFERPARSDAQLLASIGGCDEPGQQMCAGVIQGREPELESGDEASRRSGVSMTLPTLLSAKPAVEVLDQFSGGEVPHARPVGDRSDAPNSIRVWLLPVPAGPIMHTFSDAQNYSSVRSDLHAQRR